MFGIEHRRAAGEVLVFRLLDHPEADRCYCWELDGEGVCVLHTGPVDSPLKAVQASILAQQEERTQTEA